jgi:hypothetical protein
MKQPLYGYPDMIPKKQIQTYLRKHTGILVTSHRIARWISSGEIPLIKYPKREGGGYYTRRLYLDNLIKRYSTSSQQ